MNTCRATIFERFAWFLCDGSHLMAGTSARSLDHNRAVPHSAAKILERCRAIFVMPADSHLWKPRWRWGHPQRSRLRHPQQFDNHLSHLLRSGVARNTRMRCQNPVRMSKILDDLVKISDAAQSAVLEEAGWGSRTAPHACGCTDGQAVCGPAPENCFFSALRNLFQVVGWPSPNQRTMLPMTIRCEITITMPTISIPTGHTSEGSGGTMFVASEQSQALASLRLPF